MSILKSKNISVSPGIYIFRRNKTPIYIGKAANLKKRVSSYFTPLKQVLTGQEKNTSQKVKQLLQEATSLDWIETSSEVEAFLKEAELIKKYRPKYNIVLRDDKNYFYVGITKEKFPRIFITHQPRIEGARTKIRNKNLSSKFLVLSSFTGPFTSGASLKLVLKLLRRVFPYCTCNTLHKKPCLNSQIGRCLGFCCDKFQIPNPKFQNEYQSNIKKIIVILSGSKKGLVAQLKKEMKTAARNQEFEKAANLRNQIFGLENIFSHRLFLARDPKKNLRELWPKTEKDLKIILNIKNSIARVEGYDISNISGKEATGSMVVFIDGESSKRDYRKFRIKTVRGINDVDMLKEVISRRLDHPEWPFPDFMLIDGGRAQLNAVIAALKFSIFNFQFSKPMVVALAKREEELYIENRKQPVKLSSLPAQTAFFLQRVRDEAHRFARVYHHKLRDFNFLK